MKGLHGRNLEKGILAEVEGWPWEVSSLSTNDSDSSILLTRPASPWWEKLTVTL